MPRCGTTRNENYSPFERDAGGCPVANMAPCVPEAVKKFKTGGDREDEAPAEPHRARTCWGDGLPGGSPSIFFTASP